MGRAKSSTIITVQIKLSGWELIPDKLTMSHQNFGRSGIGQNARCQPALNQFSYMIWVEAIEENVTGDRGSGGRDLTGDLSISFTRRILTFYGRNWETLLIEDTGTR